MRKNSRCHVWLPLRLQRAVCDRKQKIKVRASRSIIKSPPLKTVGFFIGEMAKWGNGEMISETNNLKNYMKPLFLKENIHFVQSNFHFLCCCIFHTFMIIFYYMNHLCRLTFQLVSSLQGALKSSGLFASMQIQSASQKGIK